MKGLFSHWEIRAVALALAVMVYVFTGSLIEVDQSVTVRIDPDHVSGLDENYQVRQITPRALVIEIHGPQSAMEDFDAQDLKPELRFSRDQLDAGEQNFDVTPRLLQLPPELRLRYTSTDQVRVNIDRMVRTVVPIAVTIDNFVLSEASNAVVRNWNPEQSHVEVFGPQGVVEALTQAGVTVRSVPVAQEDVIEEVRELRVPLILDLPEGVVAQDRSVHASVTVAPKPEELQVSLPLQVMAPDAFLARYTIELHQAEVPLTILGPSARIQALDATRELVAYVDLTGEPVLDIPHSRSVRVIGPQWMNVNEAQVRVTVRLRREEESGGSGTTLPVGPTPGTEVPTVVVPAP